MFKKFPCFFVILFLIPCILISCTSKDPFSEVNSNPSQGKTEPEATVDPGKTDIPDGLEDKINNISVDFTEGDESCLSQSGNTYTFSNLRCDTVCAVSGELDGRIIIDAGDDFKFELEMHGLTLYSSSENPIEILSGDKIILTAKKDSENYIYDRRAAVDSGDESVHSYAIFSKCDLVLGGKGALTVISENNGGIHSKDNLEIKNLTLSVTSRGNSLKGNDEVTVSGGVLTLISKEEDCIKTSNTGISSKGRQFGTVSVADSCVTIYASCDGIDAAYSAVISGSCVINIYTSSFSPYSESVKNSGQSSGSKSGYAVSNTRAYSISKNTIAAAPGGRPGGGQGGFPGGNQGGFPGGDQGGFPGGWGDGPGGFSDGNSDKLSYSAKGIKAGSEINISGGDILIKSYDDSIHANNENTLESGIQASGNVNISGGNLTLYSYDDGIHADGTLTVTEGNIEISNCYEGLEGTNVIIKGGNISVVSSDDGINATTKTGTGISFEGGTLYIYAGGDGVDSNSRTSYEGINFAGGTVTIISTTSMNSSIDTEAGYKYSGGKILAICPSNGMVSESVKCSNFSSIGTKTTKSLNQGDILTVKENGKAAVSVTMPCRLSALVIYLGSNNVSFEID